jgi:hypothetical protein
MPAEEVPGRNISLSMLSRIHWTRNPHYEVASAQQVKCSAINWVVSCEKKKYWINKCHVKSNESHIRNSEYFPSYQYQYLHIIISLTKILYKKPADSLHLAKFTCTLRLRITAIQFKYFNEFQRGKSGNDGSSRRRMINKHYAIPPVGVSAPSGNFQKLKLLT